MNHVNSPQVTDESVERILKARSKAPPITPTVGRMVWFWPSEHDLEHTVGDIIYNDRKQPLSAQIAYVHNDRLINIAFIDQEGDTYSAQSVRLMQGDEACNVGGSFCEWMPFQKGQAAKSVA
jgi:hypothetical protein